MKSKLKAEHGMKSGSPFFIPHAEIRIPYSNYG